MVIIISQGSWVPGNITARSLRYGAARLVWNNRDASSGGLQCITGLLLFLIIGEVWKLLVGVTGQQLYVLFGLQSFLLQGPYLVLQRSQCSFHCCKAHTHTSGHTAHKETCMDTQDFQIMLMKFTADFQNYILHINSDPKSYRIVWVCKR